MEFKGIKFEITARNIAQFIKGLPDPRFELAERVARATAGKSIVVRDRITNRESQSFVRAFNLDHFHRFLKLSGPLFGDEICRDCAESVPYGRIALFSASPKACLKLVYEKRKLEVVVNPQSGLLSRIDISCLLWHAMENHDQFFATGTKTRQDRVTIKNFYDYFGMAHP